MFAESGRGGRVRGGRGRARPGRRASRSVWLQLSRGVEAFFLECQSSLAELAALPREGVALGWVRVASSRRRGRASRAAGRVSASASRSNGLGGLGAVRWRVGLELVRGRVEAGLLAGAGEGDVAPLLQRASVVGEHERALDREPLRLVAGERVGVRDVAGIEVAGGKCEPAVVVELDLDRSLLAVDGGDGAAAAVGDREPAVVAGAEDAVADGELDPGVEAEAARGRVALRGRGGCGRRC